jgi:hypothetical protein
MRLGLLSCCAFSCGVDAERKLRIASCVVRIGCVDVQRRVPASVASVFRSGTAGRVPEITPWWVVDACSGTDYVYRAERLGGHVEHSLQLCPVGDVCLLEHGSGVASVCFDEMLGFWT